MKVAEYMKSHLGEEFDGTISGIIPIGFFVELDAVFVEGLVHVSTLEDDYYEVDESGVSMVGRNRMRRFTIVTVSGSWSPRGQGARRGGFRPHLQGRREAAHERRPRAPRKTVGRKNTPVSRGKEKEDRAEVKALTPRRCVIACRKGIPLT